MPLYEYECKKCHHRVERIQKYSDPHMKKCPDCGGAVELVVSAPAVQFKGSGWYVTDYAKKSSAPSSSNGESAAKSEGESKSEGGSKDEGESKKGGDSKDSDSKSKKEEKSKRDSGRKTEKKSSSSEKS